jgi:SAM-dependent methyltransferase
MSNKKSNEVYDQSRTHYWNNNYLQYWKARVAEANIEYSVASGLVAGDATTTGDVRYMQAIELLGIGPQNSVLELACGFGRSLPVLSRIAAEVFAVDISEQMIEAARRDFSATNISFHVSPSEALPFDDEKFDRIVCFAAFDAMFQTEALVEMHRVCKKGGRLLLTGKNDSYHLDDHRAYEAELGARGKGHPNYFTNVKKLLGDLDRFGLVLVAAKYYERRGDFTEGLATAEMPPLFYEYLMVLEKIGPCEKNLDNDYSSAFSKTCELLKHGAHPSENNYV